LNETQRKYDACIYAISQLKEHLESVLSHKVLLPEYYRDLTAINEKCGDMTAYYEQKRDHYEHEQLLSNIINELLEVGYDKETIKKIVDKKLGVDGGFFKS
jgi:hypothetical protein